MVEKDRIKLIEELEKLVKQDDVEQVDKVISLEGHLLDESMRVNIFQNAFSQGHVSVAKLLIKKFVSQDSSFYVGNGRIHKLLEDSISRKDGKGFELVKFILDNIYNEVRSFDRTFIEAARYGRSDIIDLLFTEASDKISEDSYDEALSEAIENKHDDTISLISDKAIDKNILIGDSFITAAANGNNYIVNLFLAKASDREVSNLSYAALTSAASKGQYASVKILAEKITTLPDEEDTFNLFYAAGRGANIEIIDFLINKFANESITSDIKTALISGAAKSGHKEGFDLVLERFGDELDSQAKSSIKFSSPTYTAADLRKMLNKFYSKDISNEDKGPALISSNSLEKFSINDIMTISCSIDKLALMISNHCSRVELLFDKTDSNTPIIYMLLDEPGGDIPFIYKACILEKLNRGFLSDEYIIKYTTDRQDQQPACHSIKQQLENELGNNFKDNIDYCGSILLGKNEPQISGEIIEAISNSSVS